MLGPQGQFVIWSRNVAEWRETGTEEGTAAKSDFRRPPNQKPHIRGKMGGQWGGSGMPRSKGKPREEFLEDISRDFWDHHGRHKGQFHWEKEGIGRKRPQPAHGRDVHFLLPLICSLHLILNWRNGGRQERGDFSFARVLALF
jgi:hypothetical protein